jgi:hypothetical protein
LTQHHHDGEGCTCGLIDVHAHCLSVRYRQALTDAGLLSLDGGYPIPDWSSKLALEVMDRDGIDTMLLSVTSPTVSFLKTAGERVKLARQINEELAQTAKEHPGRFGGFATLPLPHVAECVAERRNLCRPRTRPPTGFGGRPPTGTGGSRPRTGPPTGFGGHTSSRRIP